MTEKLNKIAVTGFQIAVSKGTEGKDDASHVAPNIIETAPGEHVLVTEKQAKDMGDLLRDPTKEEAKREARDLTGVADKPATAAAADKPATAAARAS